MRRRHVNVLVSSDVLYVGRLVATDLPEELRRLFEACRDRGHRVVLPETTQLEWQRKQAEFVARAQRDLRRAYATLEHHGVAHDSPAPEGLIVEPDLAALIRSVGADVVLEKPALEDFQDAHRRACLHLSPIADEAASDEMRDLVIWAMALRIAKSEGGALLVSRDKVHSHDRGALEAEAAGLLRALSIEDALQLLHVETPAGQFFGEVFSRAWEALEEAGLGIGRQPRLTSVLHPAFEQSPDGGLESAEADIEAQSEGARANFHAEIRRRSGGTWQAILTDIMGADGPQSVVIELSDPPESISPVNFAERLRELQQLTKEQA